MWYFAWMLGLPLAVAFAILNAMWYELMEGAAIRHGMLDGPVASQASR
ncbi:MAG: cytochrome bd-I oxidase subunit CydX [Betaproteobacteria bacterium]